MTNETVPREWWEKLREDICNYESAFLSNMNHTDNALKYAMNTREWLLCRDIQNKMDSIEKGEE